MSVKVIRHRIFLAFFIPLFFTAIPSVYIDKIFSSVFTEGYSDEKFCR
jgi:hypothetical protein